MNKFRIITGGIASLCLTASFTSYYCDKFKSTQKNLTKNETNIYKKRKDHINDIVNKPQYDIVVIGGGCNGVGVLLDASTRGLRTLLIQKDDFASGASSKSTKLIHGGVRYLQQVFELSTDSIASRLQKYELVKQAIKQRSMMIDSAPHLTNKIPFVIPCNNMFWAIYYYIGSMMYYTLYKYYAPESKTKFNAPYFLNRSELTEIFPYINPKYSMGVVYQDGSFNDARMLISALLTATVGNGIKMPQKFMPGNALNKAEFLDFIKDKDGKIVGVTFKDILTNKTYDIKAKYVVNCTGAYSDKLRLKDIPQVNHRIVPVAGSHITYDAKITSGSYGLCIPSSDQRVILVVPWLNRVIAGTTQVKINQPINNPKCSDQQRKFINKEMMDAMSQINIQNFMQCQKTRWCGIRPLVAENANSQTKKISRAHVIERSKSGLYSLMGGKWTIYRLMGQDLVNRICEQEKQKGNIYPSSQTKNLPLIGATQSNKVFDQLLREYQDIGANLYFTFGKKAQQVSKGNLLRLYGSTSLAQLQWIVKNELVTDIQDVLMRRTRLCFVMGKRESLSLARIIGQLMQKQHGWSDKQRDLRVTESIDRIISYEFQ